MSDIKKKLPKGWELKKLKEVGKIISGGTPSTKNIEFWGGEIQWISPSDLTKYTEKRIKHGAKSITELGLKKSSAKLMPKGSVLFSSRAPIGYVAIADGELSTNQGFKSIIPNDFINSDFLYYFLKTSKQTAENAASGTTFKEISLSSFSELTIPVPLPETQQAIVSKIEELFSELDIGIAELKLAQNQLKVYRQSVLKYAFEGKLTNENVKDGELPEGWKILKIEDIAKVNPKLPNKERIAAKTEIQFLPMKLVEEILNKIHLTETRVFNEVQKKSYTPFIDNDIVFAKVTPCMENGKIAIVENLKNGIGYGSSEFHVVRCSGVVSNKYLFYYIVQDKFRKEAENVMTGAVGLRRVPKQFLEQYEVPIPKIEEQLEIIQEIESRLSVADKIQGSITESLQKAEALRQSILKKAFSGELINEIDAIEVPKIKHEYFHQLQLVALVINGFKKEKIDHGEMTLAKNLYLLDSIYKIPTGFKYDRWHLGPYPPALKKVVNNKEYFKRNELFIETTNDDKLQKYNNPYQDEVNNAIDDLSAIFSKYKGAERSHKTELLATVCKVIEDIKSTDLVAVRQSMVEWKIDLKTSKLKNKAEKFNKSETQKCIDFIVERGWDRKLINYKYG